jgi:hypothetical protein
MVTIRRVALSHKGLRLPFDRGDRVQVRYVRRSGSFHAVDPDEPPVNWWPLPEILGVTEEHVYDNVDLETAGWGVITRTFEVDDEWGDSCAHGWVRLDEYPK